LCRIVKSLLGNFSPLLLCCVHCWLLLWCNRSKDGKMKPGNKICKSSRVQFCQYLKSWFSANILLTKKYKPKISVNKCFVWKLAEKKKCWWNWQQNYIVIRNHYKWKTILNNKKALKTEKANYPGVPRWNISSTSNSSRNNSFQSLNPFSWSLPKVDVEGATTVTLAWTLIKLKLYSQTWDDDHLSTMTTVLISQ